MNLKRFGQFKRDSDALLQSSLWITEQMTIGTAMIEHMMEHSHMYDQDDFDRIYYEMRHLEQKAAWEDRETIRFRRKYKDILDDY